MSIPVDLGALPAEITRFGTNPLLVTTATEGPPHVSSVVADFDGVDFRVSVGRKTRYNVVDHPAITLVWMSSADNDYCLIVDAEARAEPDDTLVAHPTSAVLHRLAKSPTDSAGAESAEVSEVGGAPPN